MADVNEMTEATEATEANERVKRDPELLTIERCVRLLVELEPDAQRRAVLWLSDRFAMRPAG